MMLIISCWSQWDYNTPFMIGIRVHILRRWGICVIKFLQFFSASLDIIIIIITAEEGHQKLDFFQIGDPNIIWECLLWKKNVFFFNFGPHRNLPFGHFLLLNLGHVCSEHETSLFNRFHKLKIAMNIHSVLNTETVYHTHTSNLLILVIHSKSGWCWWYITANFLDFPPNFRLSTWNQLSKHCVQRQHC